MTISSVTERAWAAGLFEGEGCFGVFRARTGRHIYQYPRAELVSTDEDVVRRFHSIVGVGSVSGPFQDGRKDTYKPKWRWTSVGHQNAQHVVVLLWRWLGVRRKARARDILLARPIGRVYENEVR